MDNPLPVPLTCPSCNNPVEPGHKFCQICGKRMPDLPVCRHCGAQFLAPVRFCEMCGTQVSEPGVAPADPDPHLMAGEESVPEPLPPPLTKEQEPSSRTSPETPGQVAGDDPLAPEFSGLSGAPDLPEPAAAPAKPAQNKTAIIGGIIILLVVAAAGAYVLGLPILNRSLSGAGPALAPVPAIPEPGPEATLPATVPLMPEPTPLPRTPDTSLVPEPTQIMPKNQEVFINIEKDPVNAQISFLFQRGPGENLISIADIKVTSSQGTVKTGTIKPSTGQTELVIQGSKGVDRVEVIARMHSGQSYRIKDELMGFKGI